MGLLSGLTNMLFGDPTKDIRRASQQELGYQQEALDYLKDINQLPLEYRDQAMKQLMGFYSGDPATQQAFIDKAKANPFYQSMIQQGQEGVLRNAGAMGLSRSGTAATGLERSNQAVLQNFINQQLGGLQGFANSPVTGQGVASILQNMGATAGSAAMAGINAQQQQQGGLLGGLFGLLSDERLKDNVRPLWSENGHNIYSWTWNDQAKRFGLSGRGMGVIAQEVQKTNPDAIGYQNGYLTVNYKKLGLM